MGISCVMMNLKTIAKDLYLYINFGCPRKPSFEIFMPMHFLDACQIRRLCETIYRKCTFCL